MRDDPTPMRRPSNVRITDQDIYKTHVLLGTHDTVEWLRFYTPKLSDETRKKIIQLCFEVNFPKNEETSIVPMQDIY